VKNEVTAGPEDAIKDSSMLNKSKSKPLVGHGNSEVLVNPATSKIQSEGGDDARKLLTNKNGF
jgi:hypothetical protein